MKKFVALLLVLVLFMLGLTACSGKKEEAPVATEAPVEATEAPAEEPAAEEPAAEEPAAEEPAEEPAAEEPAEEPAAEEAAEEPAAEEPAAEEPAAEEPAEEPAAEEAAEEPAAEVAAVEPAAEEATGTIYYLQFKPEVADAWVALAEAYTAETGVEMVVVTAASGTYEDTLKSEIAKAEAPTLFQVNGPVGLNTWKDYCYDMSGSAFYGELTNDAFALKEGDAVLGIAYLTETYGLITNTALLEKAGYTVADITDFDSLKKVAEDITARKDELGFSAFTSAGMDSSSDWRFKTHLANMPIYYEYQADGITSTDAIKGTFLDGYKAMWDLYINNATCEPSLLPSKTGTDAQSEFLLGEAVFYQNGDWEYGAISAEIPDENLTMLPLYIGVEGEENQGLCTGTENYLCVNAKADPADVQATLDFLYWLVTSETGTQALADMGFDIPFKAAVPSNNYFKQVAAEYVAAGKTPVTWNFTTMPSENWKNGVGAALTDYAQGTGEWDAVVTAFVDGWATEVAAVNG